VWFSYTQRAFGNEEKLWKICTTWQEQFITMQKTFTFDTTYNTSEIKYISKQEAVKLQALPDMSFVLSGRGLTDEDTALGWTVNITSFSRELRAGLTDIKHYRYHHYTLSDEHLWIWSDSGGFYNSEGVAHAPKFKKKDSISFWIDFSQKKMALYKNGNQVSVAPLPNTRPVWPVVCLDNAQDTVSISRFLRSSISTINWDEKAFELAEEEQEEDEAADYVNGSYYDDGELGVFDDFDDTED